MPLLLIINFVFLYLLFELRHLGMKFFFPIYISVFTLFLLGNTWMYPKTISMSWDTTLQHLPYYALRNKMMVFIENEKIPIDKIASAFPNKATLEMIDLNGIEKYVISINDPNAEYYLFSNIMNDVKNDLQSIREKCTLVKRFEQGFIFVELYKK